MYAPRLMIDWVALCEGTAAQDSDIEPVVGIAHGPVPNDIDHREACIVG
jgi:hypothetical protein